MNIHDLFYFIINMKKDERISRFPHKHVIFKRHYFHVFYPLILDNIIILLSYRCSFRFTVFFLALVPRVYYCPMTYCLIYILIYKNSLEKPNNINYLHF